MMGFLRGAEQNVGQDNFLRRLAVVGQDGGRVLHQSELEYFRNNPDVAGMAAQDNQVVTNPYSSLSAEEMDAVRRNETARVFMRTNPQFAPSFDLSNEQSANLGETTYAQAPDGDRRATIAARLLSGDPSAGAATPEQTAYLEQLMKAMQANRGPK